MQNSLVLLENNSSQQVSSNAACADSPDGLGVNIRVCSNSNYNDNNDNNTNYCNNISNLYDNQWIGITKCVDSGCAWWPLVCSHEAMCSQHYEDCHDSTCAEWPCCPRVPLQCDDADCPFWPFTCLQDSSRPGCDVPSDLPFIPDIKDDKTSRQDPRTTPPSYCATKDFLDADLTVPCIW